MRRVIDVNTEGSFTKALGKKNRWSGMFPSALVSGGEPLWRFTMSMKQLETFLTRANGNDNIRHEVEQCAGDTTCVAKVGLRHGHKFTAANFSRWQREHK